MKRVILVSILFCLALVSLFTGNAENETTTINFGNLMVNIPQGWEYSVLSRSDSISLMFAHYDDNHESIERLTIKLSSAPDMSGFTSEADYYRSLNVEYQPRPVNVIKSVGTSAQLYGYHIMYDMEGVNAYSLFRLCYKGREYSVTYMARDPLNDTNTAFIEAVVRSVCIFDQSPDSDDSDAPSASSGAMDYSTMTLDEMIRQYLGLQAAIMSSDEWAYFDVPAGMYIVGRDIPAGRWTVAPAGKTICRLSVYTSADAYYSESDWLFITFFSDGKPNNIELKDGQLVEVYGDSASFSPRIDNGFTFNG